MTINAWMFESYDDAKTAIMEALLQELKEEVPAEVKKKFGKLIKRVNWFKLGTKAVSTLAPVVASVATGNPLPMLLNVTGNAEEIGNTVKNAADSIQSLKDEYWKDEDDSTDESTINNIRKFREEFSDALKNDNIENIVVMVDDLDRCRPERIIEILEVIKLFLAVDRTTFIIAADENVIKYSIREKYPPMNWFNGSREQLQQLLDIGCYFSLNSNMVTNEKSKEKLYLTPKTRVLIESDGPFTKIDGKKYTFNNLIKIYELVARYYNEPDIIKIVHDNFRDVLSK